MGLDGAPFATLTEAQRRYQSGFALAFNLEARPLTTTQTHGQVCPALVQLTTNPCSLSQGGVIQKKRWTLGSKRSGFESLQLSSCVTLNKYFFSLSLK